MTTVDELLRRAENRLDALAGRANPRREARFLLSQALDRSESWLLAHGDETVDAKTDSLLSSWVTRRSAGEPAHYIVGTCPFWGREFAVSPAALLPRPETELIVEGALALDIPSAARILDVGTGSGCLAVTLSLERPAAFVAASDRSPEALDLARHNAQRLAAAVRFTLGDLAAHLDGGWDLVVANLPYIPDCEISDLQPEVRDFEPRLALDGGVEGTVLVVALVDDLRRLLAPAGHALLELGPGQADVAGSRCRRCGLDEVHRIVDPSGVERVLIVRRPPGGP